MILWQNHMANYSEMESTEPRIMLVRFYSKADRNPTIYNGAAHWRIIGSAVPDDKG